MKYQLNEEIKKELAERIKYIRKNVAKQTQDKFAYSLYVSRVYINQLENAKIKTFPSEDFLDLVCDKYNISYDWLCTGQEPIISPKYYSHISYKMLNQEEPDWRLFSSESIASDYQEKLKTKLQEILDPEELTLEQYTKLIDIYITLLQPFLQFSKELKKEYLDNNFPIKELCEKHYQELKSTIKIFLSEE
ncbi:MAG: helix-turn-helix transcriptional regulator [Faecalimonas sp.]|nr:helix-turn-helix transcriptional regulator [Faecalimonas sp.]